MRAQWVFMFVAILLTLVVVRYVASWLRFSWRMSLWVLVLGALATATIYFQQQRSSSESPRTYQQSRMDDVNYHR